ncbi:MAG: sugar kinase [Rhodobacterales bacterium]|nr:MAG: sugar kinase [Rhodobacterales bacterium]
MTQSPILTVTLNPALDLSTITGVVRPDRKLRCAAPRVQPGGGGVNVARVIKALGGDVRAMVAVGGHEGHLLVGLLREQGLHPAVIRLDQPTRSSLTVTALSDGHQFRFVMPGPDWGAEDVALAEGRIRTHAPAGAVVVPSGSLPPGVAPGFFSTLAPRLSGVRVILDTSGNALRAAADATGLHTLRMDDEEARELSGESLSSIPQIARLAAELQAKHVAETVMIAAGARGTVIATDEGQWLCAPPVVKVVSAVGAGDSFVGAYALAIAEGVPPLEACILGTGAAAAACETPDSDLCSGSSARERAQEVSVTRL